MVGLEIEWHWTEVCIDLLVLTCVTPRCRRRSIRGKPTPVVSNFLIYGAVCRCNVYGEKTTLRYHRCCTATYGASLPVPSGRHGRPSPRGQPRQVIVFVCVHAEYYPVKYYYLEKLLANL